MPQRVDRDVLETVYAQLKAAHGLLMERRAYLTYDERQLLERISSAIVKADLVLHQLEIQL